MTHRRFGGRHPSGALWMLCAALALGGAPPAEGGRPTSPIYQKPFLGGPGAQVGGYLDLEFKADGSGSTFDQHRFVPFLFAEVSDRVHVASEIEFEHGGFVAGDGEIKLEFATVDFRIHEALNLRGGVVLSPLGRLNVLHDAPSLDLTERPLVTREIIPSTLSESGLGFFGTAYPSELWVIDYEVYLVNGFGAGAVGTDGVLAVRGARGSKKSDNNNSRAVVGRLGVSPRLGTELGVSVHTGDYDDDGDLPLTIAAVDGRYAVGPLEILGEYAMARGDYIPQAGGTDTAEAQGFYVEGRAHLWPGALAALPQSVFTAAARYDWVDRDQLTDGNEVERLTLGINFRPTEETAFKNDLVLDRARVAGAEDPSDWELGYRFSIASYF